MQASSGGPLRSPRAQRGPPRQPHGPAVDLDPPAKAEAKRVQVEAAPVAQQLVLVVPEGQAGLGLLQQQLSHRSLPETKRP